MDTGGSTFTSSTLGAGSGGGGGSTSRGYRAIGYKRGRVRYGYNGPRYIPGRITISRGKRRFLNNLTSAAGDDYAYSRVPRTALTLATYGSNYRGATVAQQAARKRDMYFGKGFYKGFGGDLGGWLGNKVGMGGLGRALGECGSKYTGFGAYETNDAVGQGQDIPSFAGNSDTMGDTTITYREYICDIFGQDGSFNNQTFSLNPGLEDTFPFLSQLAANYEEYTMRQLMFTFKSNIAPIGASTSGQVGEVIMATNYNADAMPFADKQSMLQSALSASARATVDQIHGVECDPSKLSMAVGKYIRTGPPKGTEDIKTYDHGLFQLAVSGIPAAYVDQPIGELWVAYTVSLRKPRRFTADGLNISRDVFVCADTQNGSIPCIPSVPGSPLNKGTLQGQQNRLGCTIEQATMDGMTGTLITLPNDYTGKLKLRVTGTIPVQAGALHIPAWSANSNNVTMTPISDIWVNGVWAPAITMGYQNIMGNSTLQIGYEAHFHVQQCEPSGSKNYFFIVDVAPVGTPVYLLNACQIDVEEYNTDFNNSQGNIVLENKAGTIVAL